MCVHCWVGVCTKGYDSNVGKQDVENRDVGKYLE